MSTPNPNPERETVPQVFDHMVAGGPIPTLREVSGVYEFDLETGGRWFLHLDRGAPNLQDASDHPDCAIRMSAEDFVDIAEGKRNLFTTLLQGRISVAGDPNLAISVRRLLPGAA